MRTVLSLIALTALSACSEGGGRDTFACPNGPDLVVTYTNDAATIQLNDSRTLVLPKTGEDLYATAGAVWQITGFRSARLTDGARSYTCDQSSL